KKKRKSELIGRFNCSFCHLEFKTSDLLQLHARIHQYPCPRPGCFRTFKDRHARRGHETNDHEKLPCPHCIRKYTNVSSFDKHLLTWHEKGENKQFSCDQCDYKFCLEINLQKHKESHETNEWKLCNTCGRKFRSIKYFESHVQKCVEGFECKICGKKYSSNIYLGR